MLIETCELFFFSSRRRHTRSDRDWSSDVCSSDLAGIALGLARAAVEYAAAYARERTAFGRPIGAFQGISFVIADRATDLEAARLLCWEAAWALGAARPC